MPIDASLKKPKPKKKSFLQRKRGLEEFAFPPPSPSQKENKRRRWGAERVAVCKCPLRGRDLTPVSTMLIS
ncbi:hypothetical protein BHE74_00013894 [Ensete ventricosum]|nr:hypothetical protein GW17_00041601 [Ensete ventricosum]RWW77910.1 hypothetical protein BHE74_00013894 [Ensete ventricosum]